MSLRPTSKQLAAMVRSKAKREAKSLTKVQKKQVKKIVEGSKETKTISQNESGTFEAWSATTRIIHLSPIASGDDEHTRDGLEVQLKRLLYRLSIHTNPTVPSQRLIRYTLFSWNGTTFPLASDLYDTGNLQRYIRDDFYEQAKGYIFHDRITMVSPGNSVKLVSANLKLDQKCTYAGALHSNIAKGNIFLALGSDVTDTNTNFEFASRMFYKEK